MVFEVGQINGAIYIYPRLTPVAMATKFGTKLAIYIGLCKRYLRDFCAYTGIFADEPSNAANHTFPGPIFVATAPSLPWQRNLRQNKL